MTNTQNQFLIIATSLAIGTILGWWFFHPKPILREIHTIEETDECYYDGNYFTTNEGLDLKQDSEECKKRIEDYKAQVEEAKNLKCRIYYGSCLNGLTSQVYEWSPEKVTWVETEISRFCAPYFVRPIGELPVKCLNYFEIKNKLIR